MEHRKVWPNSRKSFYKFIARKKYANLPAGVDTRSFVKEVDCDFVRIQNNNRCA